MLDDKRNEALSELHGRFRSYIAHEDGLIYQRSTLLVTAQSFLIATFGFSYQKKYEIAFQVISHPDTLEAMQRNADRYNIFLFLLCLAGCSTALMTIFAVRSASNAITNLHKLWRLAAAPYVPDSKDNPNYKIPREFPDVIGGGLPSSARWGISLSFVLPALFSIFWCLAAVLILIINWRS